MPDRLTARKRFWQGVAVALVVCAVLFGTAVLLSSAPSTFAASFENLGPTLGLGSKSLVETIITFVQWALGLLSLVVVIVLMYGGFLWLTARGNAEQLDKAKRTIRNGIIGLIIVLIAWAIVLFVGNAIDRATGGGNPGACAPLNSCIPGACAYCDGTGNPVYDPSCNPGLCSLPGGGFYVKSHLPADGATDVSLCSIIQITFSDDVDSTTVNDSNIEVFVDDSSDPNDGRGDTAACGAPKECRSGTCISNACVGDVVPGTFTTVGPVVKFDPTNDYVEDAWYQVNISTSVKSAPPDSANLAFLKNFSFKTGSTSDTTPPTVNWVYPGDQDTNICLQTAVQAEFSEDMDLTSITPTTVELKKFGGSAVPLNVGYIPGVYNQFTSNPTVNLDPTSDYEGRLLSGNPAPGNFDGIRDTCNNPLDGNANATAEGSPTDDYAPSPSNVGPGNEPDWIFKTGTTVSCEPKIDSVTQNKYYENPNSQITITGSNFTGTGWVDFTQNVESSVAKCFDNNFDPNVACVQPGDWTAGQIRVRVPAGKITNGVPPNGARDGPITVKVGGGPNQTSNPIQTLIDSPHLMTLSTQAAAPTQWVTAIASFDMDPAKQFGTYDAGVSKVLLRKKISDEDAGNGPDEVEASYPSSCGTFWTPQQVIFVVPDGLANGDYAVQVIRSDGGNPRRSNLFVLKVDSSLPVGPGLCLVNPSCADDPSTTPDVTLTGERFGDRDPATDFVLFNRAQGSTRATQYNSWTDPPGTSISVKVPASLVNDNYSVYVQKGAAFSNGFYPFQVPCGGVPYVVQNASCSPDDLVKGLPSPSPRSDSTDACRNAVIRALFSTDMDDSAVTSGIIDSNFELRACGTGASFDRTACGAQILFNPTPFSYFQLIGTQDLLTLNPQLVQFAAGTWYEMTIKRSVKSEAGASMNADFTWHFRTQDTVSVCAVDSVTVAPPSTNAGHPSTTAYVATPFAASCQALVGNNYTWSWDSSVPGIATVAGSNPTTDATSQGAEGTTTIAATAEGKSGTGALTIGLDYCQKNSDCTRAGYPGNCSNAVCNLAKQRCDPSVESVTPVQGPAGSGVTIAGCYFGPIKGANGKVEFGTLGSPPGDPDRRPQPPYTEAVYSCRIWSDNLITVVSPPGFQAATDVRPFITTDDSRTNATQKWDNTFPPLGPENGIFSYSAKCCPDPYVACGGGGTDPPASGVPVLCSVAPISQAAGREITLTGEQFPSTAQDKVDFGGPAASVPVTEPGWNPSSPTSIKVNVPATAPSGGVFVGASTPSGFCASNAINLNVACFTAGANSPDCQVVGNRCCTGSPLSCQPDANCNVGAAGQTCKISDNPNCPTGGGVQDTQNFDCISSSGDTLSKVPPPPENPPAVTFGNDCRVCCTPGPPAQVGQGALAGLTCTPNQGVCSGNARGLYCDCTSDLQCGAPATVGCGDVGAKCCSNRPEVVSVAPADGASNVCRNAAIVVKFSKHMRGSTFTSDTVKLYVDAGIPIPTPITLALSRDPLNPNQDQLTISRNGGPLDQSKQYRLVIHGDANNADAVHDGVLSTDGISLVAGLNYNDDAVAGDESWSSTFTTGATICKVDHLNVYITVGGVTTETTDNFYFSAGDQHDVRYEPVDANDVSLSLLDFNQTYADSGTDVVDRNPVGAEVQAVTSKNLNGLEVTRATFSGTDPAYGTASVDVRNTVFLCVNPWPNSPNPFPFNDANYGYSPDYHFNLAYCRDSGNLPALELSPVVVTPDSSTLQPGLDELLREYFFYVLDASGQRTGDAIGIRIMENELGVSPQKWYERQFGKPPAGSPVKVDGYEAFTEGRTTYVASTNLSGSTLYTNVYLLSYNDAAKPETQAIVGQLLQNWFFNTNVSDKQAIIYDTKRLADLREIAFKLVDYKKAHTAYPALTSGSYVGGISASRWPSWQETFGQQLGFSPPIDVHENKFGPPGAGRCEAGFNPDTCWNETSKIFQCPAASHVFEYVYETGGIASLHANLEYTGGGSWATDLSYADDPCTKVPGSNQCNCFNFHWPDDQFEDFVSKFSQVAAPDTTPPTISALTAPPSPLSGTATISVNASDNAGGSGMAKVEFYLDGSLASTDTTNSYIWDWDTTRTPNGNHTLLAKGYDRSGNTKDSTPITVTVANAVGDTVPPSVTITYPTSSDTVSGSSVTLSATASDDSGMVDKVDFYIDNLFVGSVITGPYSTGWDSTPYSDGSHEIIAVAFDLAGNSAAARNTFTVDNDKDKIPPTVTAVTVPPSPWKGTISVSATATDAGSGVKHVEFSLDAEASPRSVDTSSPYEWLSWDTRTIADGSHTIHVTAVDQVNLRSVTVDRTGDVSNFAGADTTPPTVSITAPAEGASVSGTINVTASASDASGINQVRFFLDGAFKASDTAAPYEWSWSTSGSPNGSHTLYAEAIDNASPANSGRGSDVRVTVANDTTPPTVTITSPAANATVSGTNVIITADASDNVAVTSVSFYAVDLSPIIKSYPLGTDNTGPAWSMSWDTTSLPNDSYRLFAVAYDAAGNSGTSSGVNVTVDNVIVAPDTTPPTTPVVTDDGAFQVSSTSLHATWTASSDPESAIARYEYSIGTSAGATDVVNWTDNGLTLDVTRSGLALTNGSTYYVNVRATNAVNLVSSVGSSDGITVDTQPPSPVSLTDPVTNQFVRGILTVKASATDSLSGVQNVTFYFVPQFGVPQLIGSDPTATPPSTYDRPWDTVGLSEAVTYTVFAAATDKVGNTTTVSSAGVQVDNTVPSSLTISISPPSPMSSGTNATVTGTAADSGSGVLANGARMECYLGAARFWTDAAPTDGLTCPWTAPFQSNFTITASVWDVVGNGPTNSNTLFVTVQDCSPVCGPGQKCCNSCGAVCTPSAQACGPPC